MKKSSSKAKYGKVCRIDKESDYIKVIVAEKETNEQFILKLHPHNYNIKVLDDVAWEDRAGMIVDKKVVRRNVMTWKGVVLFRIS